MHDKMMKMLAKKRDLSPNEKNAKMDVLKDLRDSAAEAMGHKLDGLKKVSVMSNSSEGLKKGLHKAEEIVSKPEEEQMRDDAEAPYSDFKDALEEHAGENDSNDMGMSEGGEVEETPSDEEEEQPEQEMLEQAEEGDDEFQGLDMHEVNEKLQKLMELKKRMETK